MKRINVLDKSVYNRIAAGEVVERPFSVVKELVENSIDAGSDEITIIIEDGGKSLIRVSDNGSGIHKDDLKKVFLPQSHPSNFTLDFFQLDNKLPLQQQLIKGAYGIREPFSGLTKYVGEIYI